MKNNHQYRPESQPRKHHSIQCVSLEQELEQLDFKDVFERILGKADWTDRLENGIGRIRHLFQWPQRNTELPEEFKSLIPDMKQVAAAYSEMTEGYKEFIREVLEAQSKNG